MATKADFTPEQWEELQWSVSDTTAYLALAHPGFWESFGYHNRGDPWLEERYSGD